MAELKLTQDDLQGIASEKFKPLGLVYSPEPWRIREEYYGWYAGKSARWGDVDVELSIFICGVQPRIKQEICALRMFTATPPRYKLYSAETTVDGRGIDELLPHIGWLYERQP